MAETDSSFERASYPDISGLLLVADFLTEEEEQGIWEEVDHSVWSNELARRVQHYGYRYNYASRSVDHSMHIGPLPQWSEPITQRLFEEKLLPEIPDQLIINEYEPGQGISSHIDCEPCFKDTIASISLGSTCIMDFRRTATREVIPVFLPQRSLIVMSGEARYEWRHGIAGRLADPWEGKKYPRSRRISLTFRNVILEDQKP